jgi:hypothetical protein
MKAVKLYGSSASAKTSHQATKAKNTAPKAPKRF